MGLLRAATSGMGGDSSKAAPAKKAVNVVDQRDKAILDLKNSRDRLKKLKKALDDDDVRLLSRAKACYAKDDKRNAVMLMKLRQHKQKQMTDADAQLLQVQNLVDTINFEKENIKVFAALKVGKEALEGIHKEMSVDKVLDLMDSLEDQSDITRQIADVLGGSLGAVSYSDDELNAELLTLEKATGWKVVVAPVVVALPDLPVAPTGGLVAAEDPEPALPVAPSGQLVPPAAPKETRRAEAA